MRRCLLLLLALLTSAASARAQAPFETLTFSAGGTLNVSRNAFHQHWRRGYGADVQVATPFYLGRAELGTTLHRYDTFRTDIPRFDALFAYAGWGLPLHPHPRLDAYASFRLGNYRMAFAEETFAGVRNESELAVGLHGRLGVRLTDTLNLYAAGTLLQAYTYVRLRFAYASVGLSYRFDTPPWLKTVLE